MHADTAALTFAPCIPLFRRSSQVLTIDPANPKGHWGVGRVFIENTQPHEAVRFMRRAVDLARQSRGESLQDVQQQPSARTRKSSTRSARTPAGMPASTAARSSSSSSTTREAVSDTALGIMLLDLGVALGETGAFDEQMVAFSESLQRRPHARTFTNLQVEG